MQHAGLDRVGADIVENHLDLLADELRRYRQDPEDTLGVLRRQRGDRGCGIGIEHHHRLDVGLDAGAASRIGTGYDQHPAGHHSAAFSGLGRKGRGWASSVPVLAVAIASQISWITVAIRASSSPSAMTRITGSVPDSRITKRPAVASRDSPPA